MMELSFYKVHPTVHNSEHNFSKTVNNENNIIHIHDCKMECCVIEFLNHPKI